MGEVETAVEQLRREGAGEGARVVDGAMAEGAHGRPLGPGRSQALNPTALLVEGDDEGRILGSEGVELGDDAPHLLGITHVALEEDHAADAPFADQTCEVVRDVVSRESDEEQLPRMVGEGHGLTCSRRGTGVDVEDPAQ